MKKFVTTLLKKLLKKFEEEEPKTQILEKETVVINESSFLKVNKEQEFVEEKNVVIDEASAPKVKKKQGKDVPKKKTEIIHHPDNIWVGYNF